MKLYKYYSLINRDRFEDILKNKRIFHQLPSKFNDPFEMEHRVPISDDFFNKMLPEVRKQFSNISDKVFNETIIKIKENFQKNEDFAELRIKDYINRKQIVEPTIACFSTVRDSLLMWAHYANDHKGVCLEFDTDLWGLDDDLYQVLYSDDLPIIDISKYYSVNHKNRDVKKESLLTKSKDWSYEKEYRSISFDAKKYKKFNFQGITAIFLGARIALDDKQWLFDLIKEENIDINIEQASTSKYKFELEFSKAA